MGLTAEYLAEVRAAADEERRRALAKVYQAEGAIAMLDMLIKQSQEEQCEPSTTN